MGSIDQDILQTFANKKVDLVEAMFTPRSLWDNYNMYKMSSSTCLTSFKRALIKDKVLMESLRAENFDAIFVEHIFPFGTALGQALGIRTHFLVNTHPRVEYVADVFSIPQPAGYVPAVANVDFSDQMTFLERADNTFQTWAVSKLFHDYFDATTDIFRRHWDPNFGDLLEYMRSSTPLIFVAVSEFMDFPRPIMHNVINIGGLGIKNTSSKISDLPEPFATEIETGARGVVFVSLGSIVNPTDLPDAVQRNLIDGLAAIHEYHVILKLEKEDREGIAYAKTKRNIFVTHWAPQPQLLHHFRLKMFFTHGGYNSLQEVAQSGKPVLLMPFLYDQTRNAMMVQKNGWGHMFERASLMKGSKVLERNLRMVLEDPKFEQSAKRIQNLLATKPFLADEIFIRNVQFVLDNNGTLPELNAASARLSFIHQFNLDIFILFGSVILGKSYCYLLERYKETLQNAKLTDREKLDKFNEILSTVDYLHKHGLTHGDLKADNVMIDNRGVVKVIDFDASRSFDRKGCLGGNVFTWSPEFFLNKQNCDARSADYWGLGTTLLRIWTGDDDELLSIFLYMTWNTSELRKSTQQLSELIEKILKDMDKKHSSNEWSLSKQIIQLLLGGNAEERTNNFNKVKQLLVSKGYKVSFLALM